MAEPKLTCLFTRCNHHPDSELGFCERHAPRWTMPGSHVEKCRISDCMRDNYSRGYCQLHYRKLMRHGSPIGGRIPMGVGTRWLENNMNYTGHDCLRWPAWTEKSGYGKTRFRGSDISPARAMCILVHGDPPSLHHQTAHSCGNGHLGCVNPPALEMGDSRRE